jgi:hypothetical protein
VYAYESVYREREGVRRGKGEKLERVKVRVRHSENEYKGRMQFRKYRIRFKNKKMSPARRPGYK